MNEYNYHVLIRKNNPGENKKITGKLTYTFFTYDSDFPIPTEKSTTIEFDPLTILGNLSNHEKPCTYFNKRLNINSSWTSLQGSYEYEYGFGEPLYIGNDEQYLKFISALEKIMRNNQYKTLKDLEALQRQYNLELECEISVKEPNILFDLLRKKGRNVKKHTSKPIKYEFGKINDELLQNTYLNRDHQFDYHCRSLSDILFAILHFIIIHQYKFNTCALCQKTYVKLPNHGQGKYCPRPNPLVLSSCFDEKTKEKLKNLSCEKSMSKFREIIRNKKKSKLIYAPSEEEQNRFLSEFNNYNDKAKISPTIKNLEELYSFVKSYDFSIKTTE